MRRRFVWIQGAAVQPPTYKLAAVFRRNSDCRLFVHPGLEVTTPGLSWDVADFIDTGLSVKTLSCTGPDNYGNLVVFQVRSLTDWVVMTSIALPNGGNVPIGVGGGVYAKWKTSTASGELTTDRPSFLNMFFNRLGQGGWGEFYAPDDVGGAYRSSFDESGILDTVINPGTFESYYLPTLRVPSPPYEITITSSVQYSLEIACNPEKTISIFRAWNGSSRQYYVGRDGGFSLLQWASGTTPDAFLFTSPVYIFGSTVYSKGKVYQLDGATLSFVENMPTLYSASVPTGYSLQVTTLNPF